MDFTKSLISTVDDFQPTAEQQAIVDAVTNTEENLIISALAGAAKTSTLVLISKAQPKISTLALCFNKRIADELAERLPSVCTAATLNSLGHRAWAQFTSKRLRVEKDKMYNILSDFIKELPYEEKNEAYELFSDILQALGKGKSSGYIPTNRFPNASRLHDDSSFFALLDDEPSPVMEDLIRRASYESIKQALDGMVDFDDQILLPTVFKVPFPQYPLVLVDEAQDLSALNHATLRLIARKRLIAVGDRCQSIYAFRGADISSMDILQRSFHMREMQLSVSFRCPVSVVEEARWRAPHMKYPEWAKPGKVSTLEHWSIEDLPDTATIICRNNAPIFSMALRFLKEGRYAEIVGSDIGKGLIKALKKLGDSTMKQAEVLKAISLWEKAKLAKTRNSDKIRDTAECLRVFALNGERLSDAVAYAEHIFRAKGPIRMMTGHKSKGLEFDDVFILDKDLLRLDATQDQNLLYVMQTRAKSTLTYIDSANFVGENAEAVRRE